MRNPFKEATNTLRETRKAADDWRKLVEKPVEKGNLDDAEIQKLEQKYRRKIDFGCPSCGVLVVGFIDRGAEEMKRNFLETKSAQNLPEETSNLPKVSRFCRSCSAFRASNSDDISVYRRALQPFLCKVSPSWYTLNPLFLKVYRSSFGVSSGTFGKLCRWSGARQRRLELGNTRQVTRETAIKLQEAIRKLRELPINRDSFP